MCTGAPSQPENCPLQWQFFALIISLSAVSGCISGGAETWVAAPDAETFEVAVYPALLRDCGFPDCHGSEERFFRVHGPGRTRLSDASSIYSPATPEELAASYERARSMVSVSMSASEALLLRKPLAVEAGGAGHQGTDRRGRDVYGSTNDAGYQLLLAWVEGRLVLQASDPDPQAAATGGAP